MDRLELPLGQCQKNKYAKFYSFSRWRGSVNRDKTKERNY